MVLYEYMKSRGATIAQKDSSTLSARVFNCWKYTLATSCLLSGAQVDSSSQYPVWWSTLPDNSLSPSPLNYPLQKLTYHPNNPQTSYSSLLTIQLPSQAFYPPDPPSVMLHSAKKKIIHPSCPVHRAPPTLPRRKKNVSLRRGIEPRPPAYCRYDKPKY